MLQRKIHHLSCALLLLTLLPVPTLGRPFVLVFSQDDLSDPAAVPNYPSPPEDVADFDDFPESESKPDSVLDPGSWSPLFEPDPNFKNPNPNDDDEVIYYNGVRKMVEAASRGDVRVMEEAVAEIEAAAAVGQPHAQSVMGYLYSMGIGRDRSEGKAFLHHYFAAQGGNMQSKMALAYTYYRQEVSLFKLSYLFNFIASIVWCHQHAWFCSCSLCLSEIGYCCNLRRLKCLFSCWYALKNFRTVNW